MSTGSMQNRGIFKYLGEFETKLATFLKDLFFGLNWNDPKFECVCELKKKYYKNFTLTQTMWSLSHTKTSLTLLMGKILRKKITIKVQVDPR
jgi:hypothetical protein